MRRFNSFGGHTGGWTSSIFVLAVACSVGLGGAMAQSSQSAIERIEMLRGQIKNAEAQHASTEVVGVAWLRLANRYLDQLEFPEAEDAFARSLRLLRGAGTQAEVADALDGMGSLDLDTGRLSEARECNKKALAIYEGLGDRVRAGKIHETIALAWLLDRRYREAEAESAAGLTELQQVADPDAGEMVAAYLTHSHAVCAQKRCGDALKDVDRAMAVVQEKFPTESLEMVTALLTQGLEEWKTGAVDASDRSLGEAVRLAHGLKNLPGPVLVGAQLNVMRQYGAFLKATHRSPEAAQMEAEMGRLESEHPAACNGCTVSVATLGFMP